MSKDLITQCYVCKGTVSKKAKQCPHCGQARPYRYNKTREYLSGFVLIGLSLFAILVIIGSNKKNPQNPVEVFANSTIENMSESSNSSSTDLGYPAKKSLELCHGAIRAYVTNPSTLDIHYITGYTTQVDSMNVRRIIQTFSAKNAFNLEKTFEARCTIQPNGALEFYAFEERM